MRAKFSTGRSVRKSYHVTVRIPTPVLFGLGLPLMLVCWSLAIALLLEVQTLPTTIGGLVLFFVGSWGLSMTRDGVRRVAGWLDGEPGRPPRIPWIWRDIAVWLWAVVAGLVGLVIMLRWVPGREPLQVTWVIGLFLLQDAYRSVRYWFAHRARAQQEVPNTWR